MATAAGQDAADRFREGTHHRRRRNQAAARHRAPLRGVVAGHPVQARRSAGTAGADGPSGRRRGAAQRSRGASQSAAGVRLYPRRHPVLSRTDGARGRRPGRLDGNRHADRGFVEQAQAALQLFQAEFRPSHNPPIDPIREELVMSLVSMIGPRPNLLGHEAGTHYRLEVAQPILTDNDLAKIHAIEQLVPAFRTDTLDATWPASEGADGLEPALDRLCREATAAVEAGHNILILSDRATSAERVPIPALLATSAVHHHLIRQGLRTLTGIVVETGEAREVHHFCALAGYGAEAINPYLAFATLEQVRIENDLPLSADAVQKNYLKAVGKGILKVMSKMGISTYQSYCGAQIFDAVGLASDFVDKFFTGTATTIEGVGLREIALEAVERHRRAYGDDPLYHELLDAGGDYAFRLRGEDHAWTPQSVAKLQHAVRGNSRDEYRAFAALINDQSERLLTIRGLMRLKPAAAPVPLDEVEPASAIVRRFATGAMSFGSISR